MSVPAVTRFGYGYVQGVDEADKELGITSDVELEYVCGGQFYGDADITAYMDTWYGSKGVEVVFACGGGIYTSAAEAAAKVDGKVIGVDSDQSGIIGEDITVTSAMKGLAPTVRLHLMRSRMAIGNLITLERLTTLVLYLRTRKTTTYSSQWRQPSDDTHCR